MIRACPLLSLIFLYPFILHAGDGIKVPGAVSTVRVQGPDMDIRTQNAYVRLTAYSPTVIRVRMSPQPLDAGWSYAVTGSPTVTSLTWEQDQETIFLHTDSLELIVHKSPFSLSFLTKDGRVINEDEKGLGTSWLGDQVTTYKKLQEGERFIGLGEKTGNLDRAGNAYTNWNSDVYGYSVSQDPLYSSIPFYIGVHHDLCYGVFLDNSYRSEFNFGASNNRFSSFGAYGGEMNYYFIFHTNVAGLIRSYTALTGRMTLPPLWSLGYQQNRYSYYPDTEVLRIARTLREKRIPADGITLDIHYMDHYKLFTWDAQRFPNPAAMTDQLGRMGFKTTVIVDPGIKVEKGYEAYESGVKEDIFLKYPDGQYYTGQVWPGWCHFPDFTSEKGRAWWQKEVRHFTDAGVAGIWNDMNEISTWGQKMPDNVLFDFDGQPTTHLQGHNVFGLEMARSSYEGFRAASGKRPFILSRSGYAGLQRYSAIWTGDNRAEDDHMLAGVRLLTSLGLSGIPFTGMDIGGFTGNPSQGLYTRWIQLGAFIPYFRNHTGNNSKAAEPWTFGEDILDIARRYISLRYTLLPYLYANFRQATRDGMPVMRSLAIDFTRDQQIYDPRYQNEFLLGSSILVMPQEGSATYAKVYLPEGEWYDAYSGAITGGRQEKLLELHTDRLPVFIRGGSIIPRQSVIQNTTEAPSDTLDLHIYQGSRPDSLLYYEDDGETYEFEKGAYYQRGIHFDPARRQITLDKPEGRRPSRFHHLRLVLHGFTAGKLGGAALAEQHLSFLPGDLSMNESVKTGVFSNDNQAMSLQY